MSYAYLSKRDQAKVYGSIRSKLRNARSEMIALNESDGHYGKLGMAIREVSRALERVEAEEAKQSAKVGFAIDQGVGPGDWRHT